MWSVTRLRSPNPDWFVFKKLLYFINHFNRRTIIFSISLQALVVIEIGP